MFKNWLINIISFILVYYVNIFCIYGDDLEFSQFYANRLFLNPAFAGASENAGLQLSFRDQRLFGYPITNALNVSFDQYIYSIKGGAGLQFIRYKEGIINRLQFNGLYSYGIQVNHELSFRAGIQASVLQKQIITADLIFPNQIDPFGTNQSITLAGDKSALVYDFSTGVIGSYKNKYFGFAVHHITQPNENKNLSASQRLLRKYTIHYGSQIKVFRNGLIREKFILSPNILYQYQYNHRINYGLYLIYQNISFGTWLRQDLRFVYDAAIFLVGIGFNNIDISYSYDLGLPKSGVFINMRTHEVTLRFKFQYKSTEKIEAIKCPKF